MSTVKITDLPEITHLDLNTANTILLGVNLPTDVTAKMTVTTLSEGLFHSNPLKVGENEILLPNCIAQFSGNSGTYLQSNLQNFDGDGSGDIVITADIGTNANNFLDLGINGSTFSDPTYSAMAKLDGYLFVAGSLDDSSDGNLVIGTTSTGANVVFSPGGTTKENIVAFVTRTGLTMNGASYITFNDGSMQYQAAAPANYSQASFAMANSASSNTIIAQGVNSTQNTNISAINDYAASAYSTANTNIINTNSVNNYAGSAYAKANNALANTSGTFDGDLNITGTLKTGGIVTLNNSTFLSNTAFISIVASDDFATVAPSNTNYMIQVTGKANSVTRVVFDSFGQNTYPLLSGRMARGSASNPQPTQNNDVLMRVVGNGYVENVGFKSSSPSKIDFVASENFTDANTGTRIEFWNTPSKSNTIQKIASFNAESVDFAGVVVAEKGFIFRPRVLSGDQTEITVNFDSDSTIRATLVADLNITLTNYTYGKIVEVWLTNTGAQNRTVTHGCTALNSTNKSTTFTITASSSAYLRYFSIDGDNANTFVTISA